MIKNLSNSKEISTILLKSAINRQSLDNMAILTIKIN